jgi:hypothetical protein
MERNNLKKLNEVGGKEQYQVKISKQVHSFGKLRCDLNIIMRQYTINSQTPRLSQLEVSIAQYSH